MRILILTLQFNDNYGGILQAYALQTVLQNLGHRADVCKISSKKEGPYQCLRRIMRPIKRIYKEFIMRDCNYIRERNDRESRYLAEIKENEIKEKVRSFIPLHFNIANLVLGNKAKEAKLLKKYDVIVVGSDQVWRQEYAKGYTYFLDFAEGVDIKKIAYAASFGIDNLSEYSSDVLEECIRLANLFNAISVREDSAVTLFEDVFNIGVQQTLDPTFLLDKNDYLNLIADETTTFKKNIMMSYFLDSTSYKQEIALEISIKKNLSLFEVNINNNISDVPHFFIQPSISEWLSGFRDAEYVVTDSFHGVVFSIIFEKQFSVILNNNRGAARFTSLLRMFDLENRIISEWDDIIDFPTIDYAIVDVAKKKWLESSLKLLENNLAP